jgi:redox-sensitive bicupin YhaK (pirin superfamily)
MIRIIKAAERHSGDLGWLKTLWLFSFSDYYDPDNLEFGTLRVFNDDVVAPGTGFGMHGHRDMEIVTVMLAGAITHQDSIGTNAVISAGEVQRMSAGSGVMHSEYNRGSVPVHLYQVWFPPRRPGGKPSYEQASFVAKRERNRLVHLVSGFAHPGALAINSDAAMSAADLDAGSGLSIALAAGRGLLIYVTSGALTVNGTAIAAGDQARITAERTLSVTATAASSIIAVEVAGV